MMMIFGSGGRNGGEEEEVEKSSVAPEKVRRVCLGVVTC